MRSLLGALVLLASTACIRMDSFLFAPTPADPDADLLADATDVPADLRTELPRLTAEDGTQVNAYLLNHRIDDGTEVSRHTKGVIYCHGNAQNIAAFAKRVQALWKLGYNVLIFDYRGYGKVAGKPTEPGVYADARVARAHLESRSDLGLDPSRVALYGYSLGSAVCLQMAVEEHTPALIMESAFASVQELVTDNETLDVPLNWYADAQMDNRGKVHNHTGALLVTHGEADTYIQVRYGHEVAAAAAGHANPLVTRWVPGATHSSVPCALHNLQGKQCGDAFDPEYLDAVSQLIDGAIP